MVGKLVLARDRKSVVFTGEHFLVVGGEVQPKTKFSYEKCFYNEHNMTCTAEKALSRNLQEPLLLPVKDDFLSMCNEKPKSQEVDYFDLPLYR